jgi:hypothetical protein
MPFLCIAALFVGAPLPTTTAQDGLCGITPQSARGIAEEIVRQAGYAYDSSSSAYYVSVLAPRLSPYYVIYFIRNELVVGEVEVDLCGRQGTPHPGVQYAPDSDLRYTDLLLEPDRAFAALEAQADVEPAFGTRVFPYGLTQTTEELSGIDFWWLILDTRGQWHYMTKLGKLVSPAGGSPPPAQTPKNHR